MSSDPDSAPGGDRRHWRVAIIGAGPGGLGLAVRLQRAGIHDYVIFEKSDGVGGTWRSNTYPGAACDVPSHLYSFSFDLNPNWSRSYAAQPEILEYFERSADRFGIRPHLRCHTAIVDARWDDASVRWHLRSAAGEEFAADVVVSALGLFNEPAVPDLPGLDAFAGPTIHTARWDHDVDLTGQRVAVIGTGASAAQVVPAIQAAVAHLDVFQRTPAWIVPRIDPAFTEEEKYGFSADPLAARRYRHAIYKAFEDNVSIRLGDPKMAFLEEVARGHLADQVHDPDLRGALTPDYAFGCTRVLVTSDYYPAVVSANVDLVTTAIERVSATGIVTVDGVEHPADVVVLATGYRASRYLHGLDVHGVGGRNLHAEWAEIATAHLGMTVAGYPNFFVFYGPNTNQGGNSIILVLEAQAAYVVRALRAMDAAGATVVDVRPEVMAAYNEELQAAFAGTVWTGGCRSYFHLADGRIATQMPFTFAVYRQRIARFRPEDFDLRAPTPTH